MSHVTEIEPKTIIFKTSDRNEPPIIQLKDNGDVLIKGNLAETDKELVDAMREFLKESGYLKK